MKVLGIDIGTTSVSLSVLDGESGEQVKAVTVGNDSFIETAEPWARLQDAEVIRRKVLEETERILSEYQDVGGIGLTGQMHGILYVDQEGNAVSPLFTWQDGRGNQPLAGGKSPVELIYEKTGEKTYTGYGWVTHFYNRMENLVPEKAAFLCTIADYLGMKLTGRKRPLIHSSMAASLGFYDLERKQFKTDLLEALGMECSMAPEITDRAAVLGEFRGVPVYAAIGDNQASVLGAAGKEPGSILVNMGTGGQISVVTDRMIRISGIETRPFLDGTYLLAGSSLCGGRAYAVLEKFFRLYAEAAGMEDRAQYDIMDKILRTAQGEDKLQVGTTFQGTRIDPGLLGSIEGIREENFTPAALIRGVLEGMAQELYDMYCEMKPWINTETTVMTASGNGFRKNRHLLEAFEKVFHKKPVLSPYQEEAACGAALSCLQEK